MVSLVVYVPESHLEDVKQAMFKAGAGRIGNYDSCCWQTKGFGQYRPLPGSDPYQGKEGEIEKVDEWKIELVCEPHLVPEVVNAMKAAHPYETPAYHVTSTLKA
jgi:hypothetical protein